MGSKMYFLINLKTMKNVKENIFVKAEELKGTLVRFSLVLRNPLNFFINSPNIY